MELVSKNTSFNVQQCCGKKCFKLWCVLSTVQFVSHTNGYFYTTCWVFLHKEVKSTQFVPHNSRFQIKLQISLQISALFPAINTYYIPQDILKNGGADKSLARPGRKQSTETEDFDVHISYLQS